MNISIIGAGNVGATLTRLLTSAGHRVSVANSRGPQTLSELAAETGAQARTVAEAGKGADVVIVAVPFGAVPDIARDALTDLPQGTVVVDSGNYVPGLRDAAVAELDGGVESVWTAARIGRPVVKAFNTVTADHLARLGRPAGAAGRIALPVAGDDPVATARVRDLVGDAGFDAVDAGPLAESWRQQPGTPVYTADLDAAGVRERPAAQARPGIPLCQAGDLARARDHHGHGNQQLRQGRNPGMGPSPPPAHPPLLVA